MQLQVTVTFSLIVEQCQQHSSSAKQNGAVELKTASTTAKRKGAIELIVASSSTKQT